ncbi:DUF2889 domain-containing protein [Motiliproteus sediminis]|uniref:DUF2889 domain-containing protein n=1 Tax=Motiliproteus sediminis TaxID=1468178 RepID=UPI001AEFE9A2|nr:DUF2889 domain-containing protein [Motiliproteus sediminis]
MSGNRRLLHTRHVVCQGFALDNGLWEIEGRMSDLKSFAMRNPDRGGEIPLGEPLHDITLALTLDAELRIHAVRVAMDATPFKSCAAITGAFQALKGLRLLPGFSRQAKELLGGVKGCTHLLELLAPIATTAYQSLWQSENGYNGDDPAVTGFLINSCHALAEEGEVVQGMAAQLALPEELATRLVQG